jgi:hypothetical protein
MYNLVFIGWWLRGLVAACLRGLVPAMIHISVWLLIAWWLDDLWVCAV